MLGQSTCPVPFPFKKGTLEYPNLELAMLLELCQKKYFRGKNKGRLPTKRAPEGSSGDELSEERLIFTPVCILLYNKDSPSLWEPEEPRVILLAPSLKV